MKRSLQVSHMKPVISLLVRIISNYFRPSRRKVNIPWSIRLSIAQYG